MRSSIFCLSPDRKLLAVPMAATTGYQTSGKVDDEVLRNWPKVDPFERERWIRRNEARRLRRRA
jgi:hypothetical protein